MSGDSGPKAPSTQDMFGLRPIPGISPGAQFEQDNQFGPQQRAAKDAQARLELRNKISSSDALDSLMKQDLLLQISRSDAATEDIAKKFSDAVNPDGTIFKEFSAKKDRIKLMQDQPGLNKQTLLTGGLVPQNESLLLGNGPAGMGGGSR